jgi:hypothetical protein
MVCMRFSWTAMDYHLSGKPVFRPLAEDIDPSGWLDERIGLLAIIKESCLGRSANTSRLPITNRLPFARSEDRRYAPQAQA